MMPLTLADTQTEYIIKRVNGGAACKAHLENLGFVTGGSVRVVSKNRDNLIVIVKDTRIAISRDIAVKIII